MKKLFLIFVTVFLNIILFSCTADDIVKSPEEPEFQEETSPQACCDEGEDIPPPPPPPIDGD